MPRLAILVAMDTLCILLVKILRLAIMEVKKINHQGGVDVRDKKGGLAGLGVCMHKIEAMQNIRSGTATRIRK
ncbi:hypothetical protein N7530_008827 [Penicillium desertorum]|uniref:Uncharacterized protein n=1 Tax=Penicillium desertorum TaxID=1303715 RepID=A0A9X0BL93_9EURO|nr:hypothetical protein N7530_008827 [Penicillium desertorum]